MSSCFGRNFRIVTFGESHGEAVGVVIEGLKPGIKISEPEIQKELDRRRPGSSRISSPRREKDRVEILSGIFRGKTTGHPICMIVRNKDIRSRDYEGFKDIFRPGHADFTFLKKYGIRDYRGGGRASGRETLGRVAAGALARKILKKGRIKVIGYTLQIGDIRADKIDYAEIEKNGVKCPDNKAAKLMEREILRVKKEGDSIGGIVEVVIRNCPAGLGEPVFDKLDAELAKAALSIGGVKAIEFGKGFKAAKLKGSENNDLFDYRKGRVRMKTNNAGGILGGISTGEDIVFRIAVKPASSIKKEQLTVDSKGNRRKISIKGRHDPCLCPRIIPVIESMAAIVIADAYISQKQLRR
ncbi:chorismate synthase [Candidatus Woesearchaeota archaeon]|nr:chorismate synthase [Candidatus Woesearchaeota archaeon]